MLPQVVNMARRGRSTACFLTFGRGGERDGLQAELLDFGLDARAGRDQERAGGQVRIAGLDGLLDRFELQVLQAVAQRDQVVRAVVQDGGDGAIALHRAAGS